MNQHRHDDGDDDEEEDYMSMIIEEPVQQRETLTQRKLRKQRESEAKARVPSKAERAAAEVTRRENALSASVLDPSSKGFQMMAKLGFKSGDSLGKRPAVSPAAASASPQQGVSGEDGGGNNNNKEHMTTSSSTTTTTTTTTTATTSTADNNSSAQNPNQSLQDWIQSRAEPIRLIVKEDRGGIGLDSEKKRKFREDTDHIVATEKKVKAEENEYRDRMRAEREERRLEGQVVGAQKVLEKLEEEEPNNNQGDDEKGEDGKKDKKKGTKKPILEINVLYRGLVRERAEQERDKLARLTYENFLTSSSTAGTSASIFPKPRLPKFNSEEADDEDTPQHTLQETGENLSFIEQPLYDDDDLDDPEADEELKEFNALPASERLAKLVSYMREKYWYCFWCKYRYDSVDLEGCPGFTEEDHD